MLVVMAIAMIMMGMIASAYQKVKQGQDLSMAANSVQGALQTARAQAMQLNTVVYAYFLDGGSYNWDFGLMDSNTSGPVPALTKTTDTADGYLRGYTVYDVPYEVMLVTKDGASLSRNPLPNGAAWVSLGFGAGADAANQDGAYKSGTKWKYSVDPALVKGLNRNCSLIVAFAPTGNAWAIAASARSEPEIDFYANTLTDIRIFLLDDLIGTPTPTSVSGSAPFVILSDMWSTATLTESSFPEKTYGKDLNNNGTIENMAVVDLDGDGNTTDTFSGIFNTPRGATNPSKMKWLTVKMNYITGLSSVVDGPTGE